MDHMEAKMQERYDAAEAVHRDWHSQGGSAFPVMETERIHPELGMSLRDWFAGQAIAGAMTAGDDLESADWKNCADYAYELADAMLAARAKQRR